MQPDTDRHYTIFPLNPKRTHSPAIDIQVRAASGDTANYLLQGENGEKNPIIHSQQMKCDLQMEQRGAEEHIPGMDSCRSVSPSCVFVSRSASPPPPHELMFQVSCEK